MSFVPFLRDYIDALNTAYDSISGNVDFSIWHIVQHTFIYIFETFKYTLFYLLTFQWFRDLSFLPLILPKINLSLIKGNYILEDPLSNVFTFLETPTYVNNKFLIGFLNSFFASLPLSVAHLISVRRLLVEGIPAGIASALGTVLGQCFFLICMLFGWRFFLVPFLSAEPFSSILGILLVVTVLFQITRQRSIKVVRISDKSTLVKFFFINFLLTWCEQTTLFQFLGKLSINAGSSLFEIYSSGSITKPILVLGSYVLGFFLGNLVITAAIGYILLFLHKQWMKWFVIGYSRSVNKINVALLTLILTFSLTSIPYYGLDFLIAKTVGLTSQDQSLEDSWFYPAALLDTATQMNEDFNSKATIDIDLNSFDRGQYMPMPYVFEKETTKDRKSRYEKIRDRSLVEPKTSLTTDRSARGKTNANGTKGIPKVGEYESLRSANVEDGTNDVSLKTTASKNVLKTRKQIRNDPMPLPRSFEALHFEGEHAWVVRSWHMCDDYAKGGLLGRILNPRLERLANKMPKLPTKKRISPFSRSTKDLDNVSEIDFYLVKNGSREGLLPWDNDETLLNKTGSAHFQLLSANEEENPFLFDNLKTLGSTKHRNNLLKSDSLDPIDKDELVQAHFFLNFYSRFSPFFDRDAEEELKFKFEHEVKENYYFNPLFRELLTLDVDSFLSRQPVNYLLSANEEKELFAKRQMLGKYYDTLRYYDNFAKAQDITFDSPFYKNFADRVYNQQFKGTLKIARRLFSITLDPEQKTKNKRVLKFDQPLFDKSPSRRDSLFHEELPIQAIRNKEEIKNHIMERTGSLEDLEETDSLEDLLDDNKIELPFIEETDPTPLYAGWDDQLRKFVITNRVLEESRLLR